METSCSIQSSNSNNNNNLIAKWETLQSLLKYEVTLMELSKEHIDSSIQTIKETVKEFYTKKILIKQTHDYNLQYLSLTGSKTTTPTPIFNLIVDTPSTFTNYYSIIENFFISLKTDSQAMLFLLTNLRADTQDDIISFLCEFCYENPFNTSIDQDGLLELLCRILKGKIASLESQNVTSFLDSNFIGSALLKYLSRRPDIKNYLSKVCGDIILSMNCMSQQFLSLELSRISEWLHNEASSLRPEDTLKHQRLLNSNYSRMRGGSILKKKIKFDMNTIDTYIYDNITYSKLKEGEYGNIIEEDGALSPERDVNVDYMNTIRKSAQLLLPPEIIDVDRYLPKCQHTTNPDYSVGMSEEVIEYRKSKTHSQFMKEFYDKQINLMKCENLSYSNTGLINDLANYKDNWVSILFEYKKNFAKMKFFIDKLIINLLENESIVPYTIKVICKVIDVLLDKKFPNISKVDKNAFISEFIMGKLIIPILTNPDYNGIITSSIITQSTRNHMLYLTKILKTIFRGTFFNTQYHKNYTIFNVYICEIMPYVNTFFEKLKKVELPHFVTNLFNEETNTSNPHETYIKNDDVFNHQSLCFTQTDFMTIINTIKSNEEQFISNFKYNKSLMEYYKLLKDNEKEILHLFTHSKTSVINYYLISKNEINTSSIESLYSKKKRFTFDNTSMSSHTHNSSNTELEDLITNRVKFCIKTILRNLNFINLRHNFTLANSNSTLQFFMSLSKVIQLDDNSIQLFQEEIPLGWYCLFLQYNFTLLNAKYIQNDYNLLYSELVDEVTQSTYELQNNKFRGQLEMKLTCSEKTLDVINNDYKNTKQIQKFIRIYLFTRNASIPISVSCKGNSFIVSKEKPKNANIEHYIDFIKYYSELPQLIEDIHSSNQPHKSNVVLADYLAIIKDVIVSESEWRSLFSEYIDSEDKLNEIVDDIENQIIDKIYWLIYPQEQSDKDKQFYEKCVMLNDITPEKLEIKPIFVNKKLWSIASCYINRMDIEKTPIKKLHCIELAYKVLNNCINFCAGKNEGAGFDDIFPIFIYILIQTKPQRFCTNLNFIKALMNPNKLLTTFGFASMQIEMAINYIMGLSI